MPQIPIGQEEIDDHRRLAGIMRAAGGDQEHLLEISLDLVPRIVGVEGHPDEIGHQGGMRGTLS